LAIEGKLTIEYFLLNIENLRYFTNFIKRWSARPPRLSESDGGQERYHKYTIFDIQFSIKSAIQQITNQQS